MQNKWRMALVVALSIGCFGRLRIGHSLHSGDVSRRCNFRLDGARFGRNGGRMNERIENLRTAIETFNKCKAAHEQTVLVVEMFGNNVVWEGMVESFALTGYPIAKRCYAWSYQDKGETQYVNVLEIPPVVSPVTAVRASIVSDAKKGKL
jgi:hypothetical protein